MNYIKDRVITKASGLEEKFDESKVFRHLITSGVRMDHAQEALKDLEGNLPHIVSTQNIHQHISDYLRDHTPPVNYFNYSLKRSVMGLGPSGHPFEVLVADVLATQGYHTEVGVQALGKCISHEIDVVAAKDDQHFFIECKFHNAPGVKTDIQVALYTYARFLDVKMAMESAHEEQKNYSSWLITNTKVTTEVFDYAKCVGVAVTAWHLPEGKGLRSLIMISGLHPITVLYHLSPHQIAQLLDRGVVTCVRIKKAIEGGEVRDILSPSQSQQILQDISSLCR